MMKCRKTVFTFAFIFILAGLYSQTCLPDGITFSTQEQIDEFPNNYPDCIVIEGAVVIMEGETGNIINLHGLSEIVSIGGDLRIVQNQALSNLSGLEKLETVGGNLEIQFNENLTTLHGLATLLSIEKSLYITNNPSILNLNGLAFLTSIGRNLSVQFNESMINIQGLDNLVSIGGFCSISNNQGLIAISGPQKLNEIGDFFTIQFNEDLLNISGFENLNTIGNFLGIQFNNSLELITAFSGIDTLGGFLNIQQNPLLEEIYGFENVKFIRGLLSVQYNAVLQNIGAFNSLDTLGGRFNLFNNPELATVTGFNKLKTISGNLVVKLCNNLTGLQFLKAVEIIDGNIELDENANLSTLSGLDQILPDSIELLSITSCPQLTECDVQSICEYISLPENLFNIEGNGTGCNDSLEISDKCNLHPDCSLLTDPLDGQQNVLVNTNINWEAIPLAEGYYISIGTQPGLYDMVNQLDVGDTTSYKPFNFPCLTQIYVFILPYNTEGLAFDCIEQSFVTELTDVDAGEDLEICEGEVVQLQATGSTMIQWSPIEGLDNPFSLTPNASPSQTTTYYATFSNGNICKALDSITILVKDAPEANPVSTHETGNDYNDGSCTCFPDSGFPPYSYEWSTGDTTQVIDSLAPGLYYITITDANLCSKIDSVEVLAYECPTLVPFYNQKDMSCHSICDGFVYVGNVLNAVHPVEYTWNVDDDDYLIDSLCADTYYLTVTDGKNCSVLDTFVITEPDSLLVTVSKTDESAFQSNDGTASAIPTGGTPPYKYIWSTGADSQTIEALIPGNYSVSITDVNSCFTTTSFSIEEYVCPDIQIVEEINDASCYGHCDGALYINLSAGTAPFTFLWDFGSQSQNLIGLCAGNYSLTVTDSKNCVLSDSFTIAEPEEIIVTVEEIKHVKVGQPGSIDISIDNASSYTFDWTGPDGYTSSSEDIDSLDIGCYILVITHLETSCTLDTTICVEDLTSDQNIINEGNLISLYPNPAKDDLTIGLERLNPGNYQISIIDMEGRNLLQKSTKLHEITIAIDISKLPDGLYTVIVEGEKYAYRQKLIITR